MCVNIAPHSNHMVGLSRQAIVWCCEILCYPVRCGASGSRNCCSDWQLHCVSEWENFWGKDASGPRQNVLTSKRKDDLTWYKVFHRFPSLAICLSANGKWRGTLNLSGAFFCSTTLEEKLFWCPTVVLIFTAINIVCNMSERPLDYLTDCWTKTRFNYSNGTITVVMQWMMFKKALHYWSTIMDICIIKIHVVTSSAMHNFFLLDSGSFWMKSTDHTGAILMQKKILMY